MMRYERKKKHRPQRLCPTLKTATNNEGETLKVGSRAQTTPDDAYFVTFAENLVVFVVVVHVLWA